MTTATRYRPTNKYCTDCGEEVRSMPEAEYPPNAGFRREFCACTKEMDRGARQQHEVRAWRPL